MNTNIDDNELELARAAENAANAAVKDDAEDLDAYIDTSDFQPAVDGEPDVTVTIDADAANYNRYAYRMDDATTGLTHSACGRLSGSEPTGLWLFAIWSSLKSIKLNRIREALCARYGYSNRRSAIASGRRLILHIRTTDAALAELGKIVSADPEGVLPFISLKADRAAWTSVAKQFEKFDVRWSLISPTDPSLIGLQGWAERKLHDAVHDGPIFSRRIPMAVN